MPELPNRDHHESRLARDLFRESDRQRKLLLDLMGFPAKPYKVPEEVWRDEVKHGFRNAALFGLGIVFAVSAGHLVEMIASQFRRKPRTIITPGETRTNIPDISWRITPEDVAERANDWAEKRADKLGELWADHTRTRVIDVVAKSESEELTKDDFEDRFKPIFDRPRIGVVASTETTHGVTGGGDFTAERFQEDNPDTNILKIWRHRERLVKGKHPCPLCAPLVGTSQNEWGAISPDAAQGPPLHPNCDCTWEAFIITDQEKRRLKVVPPNDWSEDYAEQYERIRSSRSLADAPQR